MANELRLGRMIASMTLIAGLFWQTLLIVPSQAVHASVTAAAASNVTADSQGRTFSYDAENKQTLVLGGSVGQYWFDGDGKRVNTGVRPGICDFYWLEGNIVPWRGDHGSSLRAVCITLSQLGANVAKRSPARSNRENSRRIPEFRCVRIESQPHENRKSQA